MRLTGLFLSLMFLTFGSSASAAEWWWISSSGDKPDRRLGFIDKESATVPYSGNVSAWSFWIYEVAQPDGLRKSKSLHRYDCKNRTSAIIHITKYGNNDRFIRSFSWKSYEQEEIPVVPDSVGEAAWNFVCNGISDAKNPLTMTPEEFAASYFKYMTD